MRRLRVERRPRVFLYVQHLLGIGHTMRAAALTRAMRRSGLEVDYVCGGFDTMDQDLEGARIVRLPPVRGRDASFEVYLGEDGAPIDDAWRARRRDALLAAYRKSAADIVLIETFPFGRWPFRFELLPLLETAREKARIVCSLRDVLAPKRKPSRLDAIVELIERYFDAVLVHGDADFIRLDATFPPAPKIARRLVYTGYVADDDGQAAAQRTPTGEVLVSAGGGATGGALMRTALAARPLGGFGRAPWRFLVGPNLPPAERAALRAADGVTVEPARPDFRTLLANAAVSVSQAGYNTAMDVLVARARSVMVPFSGHGQTEQAMRARLMAERGWIHMMEEAELTPRRLAAEIDRSAAGGRPGPVPLDLNGARRSAAVLAEMAAARKAS